MLAENGHVLRNLDEATALGNVALCNVGLLEMQSLRAMGLLGKCRAAPVARAETL